MASRNKNAGATTQPPTPTLPGEAEFDESAVVASAVATAETASGPAHVIHAKPLVIEPELAKVTNVTIEIPVADIQKDQTPSVLRRELSRDSRRILRRITEGLISDGAKLEFGKAVQSAEDALEFILNKIGNGAK